MSDHIRALHDESAAAKALIESLNHLLADDEQATADAIEGETNLNEAIADAVKRLLELETLQASIAGMVDKLEARSSRFKDQHARIREAISMAMEAAGIRKAELSIATISLRPTPPKVEVTDEQSIPAVFWKTGEPRLDKRAVMDALKEKQDVPGAMLSNGGVSISVRMS